MAEHDQSYKLLFSFPEMVADLLQGFVHEPWVSQVDLGTLERVNATAVSDDLREREDDVIWRVRWGEEWLYIYILLEFQSTVERFMAVRVMTYLGLLYQDLIRAEAVGQEDTLPPVFSVVLYNGNRRWTAPHDIGELIGDVPAGLEQYTPHVRYLLLAENEFSESELAPMRNLAAALFRLENSRSVEGVRRVLEALIDWLRQPEQERLRRAFTVWLSRVLLPRKAPGVAVPELGDLQEVNTMLAERVEEWTDQWREQGLREGLEQGIQQGLQQGIQQGLQQASREALAEVICFRFGQLPPDVDAALSRLDDPLRLRELLGTALRVDSLDELRAQLQADGSPADAH